MKTLITQISGSDLDRIFHPSQPSGYTKNGVLSDIREAAEDDPSGWGKVGDPDPARLTDALMQKYVDQYEAICTEVVNNEISHDGMEEKLAELLFDLAKKIRRPAGRKTTR